MDAAKLLQIDPAAKNSKLDLDQLAQYMTTQMATSGLGSRFRMAAFVSQVAIESWHFTVLEENLNYSADALVRVWPSHFDATTAPQYAHQPEKIANRAYADRMGNGDETSGDGWAFHGRGLIQLTGRNTYQQYATHDCVDAVNTPDILVQPEFAVRSALWFWNLHGLNAKADVEDIKGITFAINGGYNGLQDRLTMYQKAKSCFNV